MKKFLKLVCLLLVCVTLLPSCIHGENKPTPLKQLSSTWRCDKCTGYLMPGAHMASPHTTYRIDSDLPEIYTSNGVLYTTRAVLPPFLTPEGTTVPESMRTQNNNGFRTIDDSFEVFLYHLSQKHQPGETRRIVVIAENESAEPVTIQPRQIMYHGPNAAQPDSIESRLGRDVLLEEWSVPIESVTIDPGSAGIVGYTRQIGATTDSEDTAKSVFVTGVLRAEVEGSRPDLVVSVVSIPGNIPLAEMTGAAEALLSTGANSAETAMDLAIPPPECHVRRVVGTSPNVMWRNDPLVIDVASLPQDDLYFQMAKFSVQSVECMEARQSVDMLLYPGYVHPDSIGNYMMEYHVTMRLVNNGDTPKTIDLQYGKTDAPIGLAWQMIIAAEEMDLQTLATEPVIIGWAGKGRGRTVEPHYRSTMLPGGPVTIEPAGHRWVSMRLMVLGSSSLPWQLHIVPID